MLLAGKRSISPNEKSRYFIKQFKEIFNEGTQFFRTQKIKTGLF